MFFLKKYRDSSLVKNSFILILGTSIAQFLPLIIYPILARLYSPDDFGFLATLTAITSILCVISTGKYESAILIADNETKSINLIALVFAVSLIVLLLISIFVCLFIGSIKDFLGIEKSGFYLLICPLSALFINVFNVYNEWCVRNKLYKRLSYNKIVSSTMVSGGKLVFGVFRFFNSGLIVGDLSGRALTAFVCLHRMYVHELHLLKSISLKQIVTQARRFKDFPKFTMPAQLLNTVGIEDTQEGYGPCEDQTGIAIPYEKLIGSDLTPSLYLTPKPTNGVSLSELVEEVPELRGKDISAEYFITGSSIPTAMHRKPFVPAKVEDGKVATAKRHVQVPENAVILAIVSGNIRTVYTEGFSGKIAFPAGFIKVLKPIKGISAKYLAAVLSTKIVADQIKAQTVGVTIPRLNKLDLGQIILPQHNTMEEREQLISEVLSSEMSDLESELQETLDSQKREVRSTRHAMIQTLSALSSNWEQLKMYAELHEEGIKLSDTVGRINPISVKDLMGSIGYAMSTLQRQVESLRFEKPDWGKDAEINPYKFINDYIAAHSTPAVRMVNIGNDNIADFPYFDDETGDAKYQHTDAAEIFYAPVRLLERIFNNIVANAKAHGFTSDTSNNEIRFDWKSEDGGIVITIANNGRPLKDGVSGEDVLMSGFTTALNENASDGTLHSGQGGFEIKSLMEGLGTVEVISQPDAEFPVIYKLTFEKTNFETIDLFED